MLDLIIGPLGGVLAALAAIVAAYWQGSRRGAQKAAQRDLENYKETRKRIDEATPDDGITDDEYLFGRAEQQRHLRRD